MADVRLTAEVTDILNRSKITGNQLVLPNERLERKMYEAVNKALMASGGKWNTKAKAHLFDGDPRTKLGLMLQAGVAVDEKKKFQNFFTPSGLASQVAEMACVSGEVVLEPSAGQGALAQSCMECGAKKVDCVELQPENAAKLRKMGYSVIMEGDFLQMPAKKIYRSIVMNPPFTKNQDILHVAHALKFLKDGGVLVAIMGCNTTRPKFQLLIAELDYEITKVPEGTFKESGTPIATIILKVKAKNV